MLIITERLLLQHHAATSKVLGGLILELCDDSLVTDSVEFGSKHMILFTDDQHAAATILKMENLETGPDRVRECMSGN